MSEIQVEEKGADTFLVTISEGGSSTTHEVSVDPSEAEKLAGGHDTARLVEASFRFLLEREPKESILPRFDLSVITRYFPDYPSRISDYL